ncbi:MAG: ROK family protein [Actinomycetia bacterium]|nr:ROK family protein [Actinomycetes bacterium]
MAIDYVGVDLGGTKILARMVNPKSGKAVGRSKAPTPKEGPEAVLDAVVETVRSLDGFDEARAVGLGVPGFVIDATTVLRCANINGWDDPIDVGSILTKALDKPVVVGNDVNCGALAEHRLGAGKGFDDLLALFVGTGVGGGLVLNGSLATGSRGLVGEIGHLTVVADGRPCGCGGRGHLETYAGRAGMERRARELAADGRRNLLVDLAGTGTMKSRHLARALDEGDEVAQERLGEAIDALALVVGDAAALLDLRPGLLGGGVVDELGQDFVDQIVSSSAFGGFGPDICELSLAQRLDDAGVAGAAVLAADHFG